MNIDSTTYVETAVALSKGELTVKSLTGEQIAAYRAAGRRVESAVSTLCESAGTDDVVDVSGVQRTMRAFGLAEGRTANDFSIGDRVASWSNERKVGTVVGSAFKANLVEVSWDGPKPVYESVVPSTIVRRGKADALKTGTVAVAENGVIEHNGRKMVITDAVIARHVAGKKVGVTAGRSALFAVCETSDGIVCTAPLTAYEEVVRKHEFEVKPEEAETPEPEKPENTEKKEESFAELRQCVSEAILGCDGDPSDAIKVAAMVSDSMVDGNNDWSALVEQAFVSFAKDQGRVPLLGASTNVADKVTSAVAKRKGGKVPFHRPLASSVKRSSDMKVEKGTRVNLNKVGDMIDHVQRAIQAGKLVRSSNSKAGHRSLAQRIFDIFRVAATAGDEPWIPFRVHQELQTEHASFAEAKDEFLVDEAVAAEADVEKNTSEKEGEHPSKFRLGQRTNFTVSNPLTTSAKAEIPPNDVNDKTMDGLETKLVSYRQTLQRLSSQPTSTQLARRAGNLLLSIISFVDDHAKQPWAVVAASSLAK